MGVLGCKGPPKMNFMELYFVGAFKLRMHRYIWELVAPWINFKQLGFVGSLKLKR